MSTVPQWPSYAEATAAVQQIEPQMLALQAALEEANTIVGGSVAARSADSASAPLLDGRNSALGLEITSIAGAVASEISYTLKGVINILGLGKSD